MKPTIDNIITYILQNNILQEQTKQFLIQKVQDSLCKCYTGRMSRLINCLSGFDPLVNIQISTTEQIGQIISIVKDKLYQEDNYTVENHKQEVTKELLEREYTQETINEWIEYIE